MRAHFTFLLILMLSCSTLNAQEQVTLDSTVLDVRTVITGMDIPWEILWGPDDQIWATERYGRVSRIDPENGTQDVILDISSAVYQQGESGLLGMALHPDFETTPEVFLVYTYLDGNNARERLVKYTYNGTDLVGETILLDGIIGNTTHDGSRLLFLADETLLMSTGDAQDQPSSQDVSGLNGKFLRINKDGSVPSDNPISGSYVWSWGHRNAQGLAIGPGGKIYSSEHGPQTDDEFNLIEPSKNYGWPTVHGFCDSPNENQFCTDSNVIEPIAAWTPTIAVSDIIWYDHEAIPEFEGNILMTTLKAQKIVRIKLSQDGTQMIEEENLFNTKWGRLRDICMSPDGKLYLATNGTSWVNNNPFTHSIIELNNPNYTTVPEIVSARGLTIKVIPNPIDTEATFHFGAGLIGGEYQLLDATGRVITSGIIDVDLVKFNRSDLPPGVYFLEGMFEGRKVTTRMVAN